MDQVDFTKFVEWAFLSILTGSVVWSAKFLAMISKSISQLNLQVALILERIATQQKEIDNQKSRIVDLEKEINNL